MKVPLADWKCSDKEREYVNKVLDSGWLTYGPYCRKLEQIWASYHNCAYGVVNNSGTSALQLAFRAIKEVGCWDNDSEVLVPAITFPATINMVIESGLVPVLCDVERSDGMLSIEDMEKRVTPKTKAVCVVHLWGMAYPRKSELFKFCEKHGLRLIEDSCETIDPEVGNWGDVSCFSMYFNHIISAGVGGMACTNDAQLEDIMRSLANHGMRDTKVLPKFRRFTFNRIGYSMRITELEAALGVAQWENIDKILADRKEISKTLTEMLQGVGVGDIGKMLPGVMMFPIIFNGCISGPDKIEFMKFMDSRGVEMREMLPITNQASFEYLVKDYGDYPNARHINNNGVFFPIHPMMTKEHCEHIRDSFKEYLNIHGFNGREEWLKHRI